MSDFLPANRPVNAPFNATANEVTEIDAHLLDGIAERINDAVFNAESAARSAVQYALEAGELLNQAKQKVGHGEWLNWLGSNIKLAPRTCQAYMRLATKVPLLPAEDAQRVTDLPVREAIHAITTTPTGPRVTSNKRTRVPDRTARETIERNMRNAADELRRFSKAVGLNATKHKDVERTRQVLNQALAALPRNDTDHRESAVRCGQSAIGKLQEIAPDNPHRDEAFDDVVRWIEFNRGGAHA